MLFRSEFAADISASELRANPNGMKVTFIAQSGPEKTITISGSQITAQLAAVDAVHNPAVTTLAPPSPPHQ